MPWGKGQASQAIREVGAAGIDPSIAPKMEHLLKDYLCVGGMPEVVRDFAEVRDYRGAREIQNEILQDYDSDYSKHMPARLLERGGLCPWGSR